MGSVSFFVRAPAGGGVGGLVFSSTHPLSPNPFPPSPGRKGGPHFASGVRHRVNRERLKSGLARQELTRRVPSAGDGMGWGEVETGWDAVASGRVGEAGGVLSRRWRVAASRRVGRHTRTCYDRLRPILPRGSSRDARAVEAFPDRQSSNEAPPFRPGEGGKGAGGIGGGNRPHKHKRPDTQSHTPGARSAQGNDTGATTP